MEQQILAWVSQYGYVAIFGLLVFGIVGLPIPDETLLTFTGYLIYKGNFTLALAFGAALAGSATGITISYALGRRFGLPLIHRYGRYVRIKEEHLTKTHAWFDRAGHWSLTFGYFVPGVRHFTAYVAGMTDLPMRSFAMFAYAGAILWVTSFISLGYFLGERWQAVQQNVHHYLMMGFGLCLVAIVCWLAWRKWGRNRAAG